MNPKIQHGLKPGLYNEVAHNSSRPTRHLRNFSVPIALTLPMSILSAPSSPAKPTTTTTPTRPSTSSGNRLPSGSERMLRATLDRDRSASYSNAGTSSSPPSQTGGSLRRDENSDPFTYNNNRDEFPPFDTMASLNVHGSTRRPQSSSGAMRYEPQSSAPLTYISPPIHRTNTSPAGSPPTRPRVSIPPRSPSNPQQQHRRGSLSLGGAAIDVAHLVNRPSSPSPLSRHPQQHMRSLSPHPPHPSSPSRSSLSQNLVPIESRNPVPVESRSISMSHSASNSTSPSIASGAGSKRYSLVVVSPTSAEDQQHHLLRTRLETALGVYACDEGSVDVKPYRPLHQGSQTTAMQMHGYYPQHPLSPLSASADWDNRLHRTLQRDQKQQSQSPISASPSMSSSASSSSVSLPTHFNPPRTVKPHPHPTSPQVPSRFNSPNSPHQPHTNNPHSLTQQHMPTPPPSPQFDAKTAAALLRSREGYVSFADIKGLCDPTMHIDDLDHSHGHDDDRDGDSRGKTWWGLLWRS